METVTFEALINAITTVGFPIVCVFILGYLLFMEQKNHKEEMNVLSQSINSNTMIMTELKQLLEDIRDSNNG